MNELIAKLEEIKFSHQHEKDVVWLKEWYLGNEGVLSGYGLRCFFYKNGEYVSETLLDEYKAYPDDVEFSWDTDFIKAEKVGKWGMKAQAEHETWEKIIRLQAEIETTEKALATLRQDVQSKFEQALKKSRLHSKASQGIAPQDKIDAIKVTIMTEYNAERQKLQINLENLKRQLSKP